MKRFQAHVVSRTPALEQTPEVFEAVGVYAAIYVLSGMVNDLMRVIAIESFIRHQSISVECSASSDVLAYFFLQYFAATVWNYTSANLPATFQVPTTVVLSFPPLPVMRRFRSLTCMFRAFPPMKVSSTSTSPPSLLPKKSSCMARRIRWSMNHADF